MTYHREEGMSTWYGLVDQTERAIRLWDFAAKQRFRLVMRTTFRGIVNRLVTIKIVDYM